MLDFSEGGVGPSVRSRKEVMRSILKRAFNENRGAEAILLIQWRRAYVAHKAEPDVQTLRKFEEVNAHQPRAVRALNLLEEKNGRNVVHKITEEKPQTGLERLNAVPEDVRIIMPGPHFDLATMPAFNADHYDPMEGLQIVTGYALACRAYAELAGPPESFDTADVSDVATHAAPALKQ